MKLQRILIDIGHPAQVHQFKHIYAELRTKGYDVLFTTKDKDIALYLLSYYEIPYCNLGKPKKGLIRKVLYIPTSCFRFYKAISYFQPDIVLSRFSFHASWVSFLLRKKHIGFTDTEHVGLADTLTVPFVTTKLTAYSYNKNLGKNHLRFSGNIELFYLHPNRFKPDPSILDLLGVEKDEKYVIIRFVSWEAHHDVGESGLSLPMKIEVVKELSKYAKVFITSEGKLPENLEQYQIKISPEKMHDALYYASLFFGESPTMTSEAALLGTPAVLISSWACECGNTINLKNYELTKCFTPELEEDAYKYAINLIKAENAKEKWKNKRAKFLSENIDVTQFVIWFIENFPESIKIVKANPDYQYNFK